MTEAVLQRTGGRAFALLAIAASLALGLAIAHPVLWLLGGLGLSLVLLAIVPVEVLGVVAIGLAAGLAEPINILVAPRGTEVAMVLVAAIAIRACIDDTPSRRQLLIGGGIAAFLLISAANAVTLGLDATLKSVWAPAAPYALLLLVFLPRSVAHGSKLLDVVSALAAGLGVLFVIASLTGSSIFPGTYNHFSFSIGPLNTTRIFAHATSLFAFAAMWASVKLVSERRLSPWGDWLWVFVACTAAVILDGSRTQFVGLMIALAVATLVAVGLRRPLLRVWAPGAVLLGSAVIALAPSLSEAYHDIRTSSGTFRPRVVLYGEAERDLAERPALGIGFTPATVPAGMKEDTLSFAPGTHAYDPANSSLATLVIRFGVLGLAGLGALALVAIALVRRGIRVAPEARAPAALVAGMLTFMVAGCFTTPTLVGADSLAPLGLALGAAAAVSRPRADGAGP